MLMQITNDFISGLLGRIFHTKGRYIEVPPMFNSSNNKVSIHAAENAMLIVSFDGLTYSTAKDIASFLTERYINLIEPAKPALKHSKYVIGYDADVKPVLLGDAVGMFEFNGTVFYKASKSATAKTIDGEKSFLYVYKEDHPEEGHVTLKVLNTVINVTPLILRK